ncbi:helix-turn-helix domain-containing protein [Listeria monocytogenes]|uniref:Helix-turn-helix domain-containing protein n=1 Tax=Listeria monocytogenes TaxID=1639 RepID=A0AAN2WJW7_LISMN|nr:helix-turn-helix domain-containing protein [Listeria monocytogenes]EAC3367791.1 helix-turn-helix domain-containing protein [Listeria monocytogenes]EAC7086948.1 helix-turn-helix domain-containing protein [Listeria monocytogenes]EAC8542046.1 helix-turn-helix domain-containing protein [Listeria monocytogenes]EAC8548048.1 helix-turn-helix domain-containing protein [Listeria monocytogenes]
MEFNYTMISNAKNGDEQAITFLMEQFKPLMLKEASRNGNLDEDCLQELRIAFVKAIQEFDFEKLTY